MIFRHKPFEIDVIQYDGSPEANRMIIKRTKHSKTPAWLDRSGSKISGDDLMAVGILTLTTPEGDQQIHAGDYIGEGVDGSYCAFPKDYFEATYEPLLPPKPIKPLPLSEYIPLVGLNGKRLN